MAPQDERPPMVSIVMPVRNEGAYIERSLKSVFAQDYPYKRLEVLIIDGNSDDDTKSKIAHMSTQFPKHLLKIIDNHGLFMPIGFNLGLRRARGEIIIMLGGHAEIAHNYVSECVKLLAEKSVACVGGAMEAVAESWISQAIAIATGTPFGVGDVAFRIQPHREMEVDTVVYAAYRRSVFEEIGLLDEEMVRNQDDEFNYRLREHGEKILFSPTIRSRYFSRSNFSSLWKQYFQYGYWKVRVLQKHPRQMRLRQFVPAVFVASILGSLLLIYMPFNDERLSIIPFSIIFGSYLLANLSASMLSSARGGWRYLPLMPIAFAILHFSYGVGFLFGLLKFAGRWGDRVGKVSSF